MRFSAEQGAFKGKTSFMTTYTPIWDNFKEFKKLRAVLLMGIVLALMPITFDSSRPELQGTKRLNNEDKHTFHFKSFC